MPTPGTGKIDLRSDTKTLPSPAMRQAMAEAEVGDDVSGEDPTVNRLEATCAERLGKEAGLFVASGTMGNLVCLYTHTRRGQDLIVERRAHLYHFEVGGLAEICGLVARPVEGERGRMSPEQVEAAITEPGNIHTSPTGLLALENSHNLAGGTVLSVEQTQALCEVAHAHGLPVHLDGARIFNAAVAAGVEVSELVAPVDSVQICFSKGLGAPVGSMICGTADFIEEARRVRKLFGGGMRQAGVIAAAAEVALRDTPPRLAEDHANARLIADTLAQLPGISVDLETVQTNMVYFAVDREDLTAPALCDALGAYDIIAAPRDEREIRFVTHVQVSRSDAERVCAALTEVLG